MSQAIRSFEVNGFKVTSINRASELADLRIQFPSVSFSTAANFDGVFAGRYGPSLGALFDAGRGAHLCGIVNADIYMLSAAISDCLSEDAFHVARRLDIAASEDDVVGVYRRGIDAVFFDPTRFAALMEDDLLRGFQLGAPFWDIVTPILASFHGRVSFVEPPFILHRVHPANWSVDDYALLKKRAVSTVVSHARRHADRSTNAARFLTLMEKHVGDIDRSLRSRRALRRASDVLSAWLLNLEMRHCRRVDADLRDPVLVRAFTGPIARRADLGESVPESPRKRSDPISIGLRWFRVQRRQRQFQRLLDLVEA